MAGMTGVRETTHVMNRTLVVVALTTLFAPALTLALAPAPARAAGARNTPPARTEIHLAVFGNDPCPTGVGDEIVVCARLPEAERYRIPKRLRDEKKLARPDQSWVARARDIDTAGAELRPTACSAIGSGGTSGCFQKFMRDARAQKAADAAAASSVP